MIHLRLRVPDDRLDTVVEQLLDDDGVTNLVVTPDAFRKPRGGLVEADVAREGAQAVVSRLRRLDLHHEGSITLTEPDTPRVALVTTDGFLFPNAELEKRGLLQRKGFPESYDRRALLRFVAEIKSGRAEVTAPVYSHLTYDIVPGERIVVRQPDVLIVEGLNVLQAPQVHPVRGSGLAVSDFFDFSVYVDAWVDDVRKWYVERFLRLRETAFSDPDSYFHRYAVLSDEEAVATANRIWREINGPTLVENILPTRSRASLVLSKGDNHEVRRVRLRKI
jgi:type I pantothenate kinase